MIILFLLKLLISFTLILPIISENVPCNPRKIYDDDRSVVCVCNATYCDTQEPLSEIPTSKFFHLVSSKDGLRFQNSYENLINLENYEGQKDEAEIKIYSSIKFQTMIGFGGAFTDAAGQNLNKVSRELKDFVMNSYFGKNGLEYNIGRIPIGGADFSDRPYTYCDEGINDTALECFKLQPEDMNYKIPYVHEALKINPKLKLFASAWSAPAWMKSNNKLNDTAILKQIYYSTWADYYVKFFEEYRKNGVEFWGVTTQNEPIHGLVGGGWNCMGWTPQMQAKFIKENFGPKLREKFPELKIMILDDQRFQVVYWLRTILSDPETASYVSGVGLHWYANNYFPPDPLDVAHDEFPEYFMLNTEACTGYLHIPGNKAVDFGSWYRGELYAHNIIEDLNHWLSGWVEWNLVLDETGGPNWAGNNVDAPIILNVTSGEAYKQPMYYALGHFTKYIPEGSVRIYSTGRLNGLQTLSVLRQDGNIVLVVLNTMEENRTLIVRNGEDNEMGLKVQIGPKSLHTIVFKDFTIESTTKESGSGSMSRNLYLAMFLIVKPFLLLFSYNLNLSLFK